MRLLRTFPAAAFAAVLVSIVGFCVAERSVGLLLVGGVLAALSWYVTEGPRGRSLPGWTANVLIIAVALNVVVDLAGQRHDAMGALGRFLVWLTLIKLYQRKTTREYAQLLGMSLLLMLVGCLQSVDLLFAACLLVYAMLGVYVLLLFRLYAAYERSRAARLEAVPPGYRLVPSLQPGVGRRLTLHFRSLMVGVGAGGLLFSLFLFVLFPRDVGRGALRPFAIDSGWSRAGFSQEVNLTSGTRITDSQRTVLKLRLKGSDRAGGLLRLRGAVLDRYEGRGRWTASPQLDSRMIESRPDITPLTPVDREDVLIQEFETLIPSDTMFSVYMPVAVATPFSRAVKYQPHTQTLRDVGGGLIERYTVCAVTDPTTETLEALAPERRRPPDFITRQFRDFDPRVKTLAGNLLLADGLPGAPPADDAERWRWNARGADALTRHLQGSGYEYTTDLSDVRLGDDADEDPIARFLFETHRGHCEYLASALAAMCNSVGIPARLVTGYVALEFDQQSNLYIVRESNAHAWVEVQVGALRWATFDPTSSPILRRYHAASLTISDRWRRMFDRFEAKWSNNFVAFDRHAQARLIDAMDFGGIETLNAAVAATRQWLARVNRSFRLGPAGYIWMGIVAVVVLIAAVAAGTRLRRAARLRAVLGPSQSSGASRRALGRLGFYVDMLTALERAGVPKPAWQPPLRYARTLIAEDPARGGVVRDLTQLFYAARYGGRQLTNEELSDAASRVRELG